MLLPLMVLLKTLWITCIYFKFNGSRCIFLVLYVDDILFATSDEILLKNTKEFLSKNFEINDTGEASYVIDINIYRDRFKMTLYMSHKVYIERVLKKFKLSEFKANATLIVKDDKFNLSQCLKNT